jgi:hypothetical protein
MYVVIFPLFDCLGWPREMFECNIIHSLYYHRHNHPWFIFLFSFSCLQVQDAHIKVADLTLPSSDPGIVKG